MSEERLSGGKQCPLEGRQGWLSGLLLIVLAAALLTAAVVKLAVGPASRNARYVSEVQASAQPVEATPKVKRREPPADDAPERWVATERPYDFAALLAATPAAGAADGKEWTSYRGSAWQTGVSRSKLPAKLRRKWSYQLDADVVGTPVVADGLVIVAGRDGLLAALKLSDGEPAWGYEMGAECSNSPLVMGDLVVIGDDAGGLHGVDLKSGRRRWRVERNFTLSTSQKAGGLILTGGFDEVLQAARPRDGSAAWTWQNTEPVVSPPTVLGDELAFGGCDKKVHFVSLSDGSDRGSVDTKAEVGAAIPFDGQALYVMTYDGVISRMRRGAVENGLGAWRAAWELDFSRDGAVEINEHAAQTPAVIGDRVVAAFSDGTIRCLRAGDALRYWVAKPGAEMRGSPVIADGRVIVGDDYGTLYVLSLENGATLWKDVVGSHLVASPAVAEGCVIVATKGGTIICYGE